LDVAYLALSMDIVTDYSFGQSTNYLQRKDFALEWRDIIHGFVHFITGREPSP
jgi:hypothetical protein